MEKLTLVLGASTKESRYSNIAIRRLRAEGYPVIAVGLGSGKIDNVEIVDRIPEHADIHTVAIYLNAGIQGAYYSEVIKLEPERVIFPPGAENEEFERKLHDAGIEVLRACTMVMLSTGEY